MAAPRHPPQNVPPDEKFGSRVSRMWKRSYNYLLGRKEKEKVQEDAAQDLSEVPDSSQSPKDVVQDDALASNVKMGIQPEDMDHPPALSRPSSGSVTPRHTPPHLSPVGDPRYKVAYYENPRCGTESEVSNPDSPQVPSYECWKYELLPTSDSSPTAIRAKLTRSIQDDDDSKSDNENCFSEEEDAPCQQSDPLHATNM